MRRGDFGRMCPDRPEDCLVPLDKFVEAVEDVQKELHEKRGVHVPLVYAMSGMSLKSMSDYYLIHLPCKTKQIPSSGRKFPGWGGGMSIIQRLKRWNGLGSGTLRYLTLLRKA